MFKKQSMQFLDSLSTNALCRQGECESRFDLIPSLFAQIEQTRERQLLEKSLTDHVRNGRGFWPIITLGGVPHVVRFLPASSVTSVALCAVNPYAGQRWTLDDGQIDVLPLHALSVSDWPRVCLTLH